MSGCGRRLRSRLDLIGGVVAINVRRMMLRTRDAAPGKSVAEQALGLRRFDVVDLGHGALGVLRKSIRRVNVFGKLVAMRLIQKSRLGIDLKQRLAALDVEARRRQRWQLVGIRTRQWR